MSDTKHSIHPPPGWVYCLGCGQTFQHIDGCPDCRTTDYLVCVDE